MPFGRAKEAADNVQRGQAVYALLPQTLREWIWGAIVLFGSTAVSWVVAATSSLSGWQLYVSGIGVGCAVTIVYATVRSMLRGEPPEPQVEEQVPPQPDEQSSSNAARLALERAEADTQNAKRELRKVKSENTLPEIVVQAWGGKEAVVEVRNKGRAFQLVMHAQIVRASQAIDHQHPWSYYPRKLSSGGQFQTYRMAWVSEYGHVYVSGEVNATIQEWSAYDWKPVNFDLELTFLSKESDEYVPELSRWVLSVAYDPKEKQLQAAIKRLQA